jgi:hypothetical protein
VALIEYVRPLILAGGFLFLLVGLNILIVEQPTYEAALTGLYTLILYTFYLYLVFVFLSIIVAGLEALLKLRSGNKN